MRHRRQRRRGGTRRQLRRMEQEQMRLAEQTIAAAVELAEGIGRQRWVLLLLRSAYEEEEADKRILHLQLMLVIKALT